VWRPRSGGEGGGPVAQRAAQLQSGGGGGGQPTPARSRRRRAALDRGGGYGWCVGCCGGKASTCVGRLGEGRKRARPTENSEIFDLFKKNQTSLNCFDQNMGLPSSKNFK
jgi:hypothetical protein